MNQAIEPVFEWQFLWLNPLALHPQVLDFIFIFSVHDFLTS
jgi:hypothetical protein